jgi:ubiquinone/menaquinone biosynthesis C-methylase UbiE
MTGKENHLVRVFKDASTHKEVANVISRHLTSKKDIRDVAFEGVDFSGKKRVLDLGCGFGFFTEGLSGKAHSLSHITGIDTHPEYEWFYFHSCEKVDRAIKKKFISQGIEAIRKLEPKSYDLILCSYALYFFPEMIPEIGRVLKNDGSFIAITHAMPHMHQFSEFVRNLLSQKGIPMKGENPYEALIRKFSDANGVKMLSKAFDTVCTKNYRNKMVFNVDDFSDLSVYFNFKRNFFIPSSLDPEGGLHSFVLEAIKDHMEDGKIMEIAKDDVIFTCSDPINLPES